MTKSLCLVDGSGFIFRAYHALPPLTNPKGVPVGAVVGFLNMMTKLMDSHECDHMAVIFDAARVTFRNRIYPEYKAHRPPAPEDLVPQFAIVRDATRALGLPAIELEDYEADDIIATYAAQGAAAGMQVKIISSDKDLMQLIGGNVSMYDAMKNRVIDEAQVIEKFGVPPNKVLEVLSLIGDSSDNVPGVPSIGPKTAAELINTFGDLETLLARADEIKQPKRREVIMANADNARLSRELITLKNDVPVLPAIEEFAVKEPQPDVLLPFLQEHGFKNLLAKMQVRYGGTPVIPSAAEGSKIPPLPPVGRDDIKNYTTIRDLSTLREWLARAGKTGYVAFDTETTALSIQQAELVGFSLSTKAGEACYVPLQHISGSAVAQPMQDLFAPPPVAATLQPNQIPLADALAALKPLLEDEAVLKIGHNIKYDYAVMDKYGIRISPIEDTMLLSYCLHAGEHGQGMDELSERYLGVKPISYDEVTGTGKGRLRFDEVEIEKASAYAAEDADITLRLWEHFKPQLAQEKMLTLYETIERPLVCVLAQMEAYGIKVDVPKLTGLSSDFASRMGEFEREIHALAGHSFNVGSPKQLGEVLFDEMNIEGGRKSAKTGAYSTDNAVLEELAEAGHTIAQKIIEWRQLAKLKSTYADALAQQVDAKTKRVHTNYAMAIASTGRLSSNDPNLQNIPIRTIEGKKIRHCFIAEPGFKLLSADYSQIELRLLAHMADIPTLKEAFRNGGDIHAVTASQMFGVPLAQVDGDLRRSAKTINFGIIYGMSAHGLAARLGIGRSEAAAYIEQYFAQYPGIKDYMERTKAFAREHGYVTTLFGRRCHVPYIHDKNAGRRQFAERAAINAPLQGTAADIIKRAMIALNKTLAPHAQNAKMLLQVHDELVFEVRDNAIDEIKTLIKRQMEHAAQLSVPLTVDIGEGSNWGEAH